MKKKIEKKRDLLLVNAELNLSQSFMHCYLPCLIGNVGQQQWQQQQSSHSHSYRSSDGPSDSSSSNGISKAVVTAVATAAGTLLSFSGTNYSFFFFLSMNQKSLSSWNSFNYSDNQELEWKPEQTLLLSRVHVLLFFHLFFKTILCSFLHLHQSFHMLSIALHQTLDALHLHLLTLFSSLVPSPNVFDKITH